VLDVGVGTGTVLSQLVEMFHPQTIYGLDPSPAMLELASKKVPGLIPVLGNDSAMTTDTRLRDLDLVMANFVLAYSGPEKMVANVKQTLRPGGTFALTTTTMRSFRELLNIAAHPIFRVISLGYGISPETVEQELPPVPRDPDDLCAHLERGGFEVVDVRARVHPLRFRNGRALYEFGREGGWWLDLYQRMSVTERSVPWLHLGLRACQLLRLLDRDCTTSMETCAVVARLRT
jgi:SAM-dependent methyltransferase